MKWIRISIILLILLTILLGIIYPLFMWGIGQLFFPHQANGSFIFHERKVVGSKLIGQTFEASIYFHPRPSYAGKGYDAAQSGASNLGPTSKPLMEAVQKRVDAYRQENQWQGPIPADAVLASASGLDPHISVENAKSQAGRVAQNRNIELGSVMALIDKHTEGAWFGKFGQPRINVLELNLDLDSLEKPGLK